MHKDAPKTEQWKKHNWLTSEIKFQIFQKYNFTRAGSIFPEGGGGGGGRDCKVRRAGAWFLLGRGSDPVAEIGCGETDVMEPVDIDLVPWHWNSPSTTYKHKFEFFRIFYGNCVALAAPLSIFGCQPNQYYLFVPKHLTTIKFNLGHDKVPWHVLQLSHVITFLNKHFVKCQLSHEK